MATCEPAPLRMHTATPTPRRLLADEAMTLIVVFDNNTLEPRLQADWGFAAWLECGGQTVLFDTGADGVVLLHNMARLGLDPRVINSIVLSHIHGDHTGGLAAVLAANPQVTVYLPKAFPARLKRQARAAGATVLAVTTPLEIGPGLWSTGQMGTTIVEQALIARAEKGLVLATGCAHPGIGEMATRSRQIGRGEIALVVGGFHLRGASRMRVEGTIRQFRRLGVQHVAPCHCTGHAARALFRQAYGENFHDCGAGWRWHDQALIRRPAGTSTSAHTGSQP
jgi:7,8-dihydropterin-6-yl-methyl-4-(beta-D-ribofuranosyl)aminobenzene 5'-phosphate synthase